MRHSDSSDFPSDDGGANGLLSAPVRRVDSRLPEKGEDGRELGGKMRGEALGPSRPHTVFNALGHLIANEGYDERKRLQMKL